ncbi:MAG: type II secretion system protein [Verrucomicrobia bacterium]|nr:type II secretion system protein [Verrucomicrobiota bacterium]MDA1005695.1 type II secretion system protein [Verrucomicrobiota bacterium]
MNKHTHPKGFTLMESVIAIGIVAILLTTFLAVFGPATQGIRKAISIQEADRLASALERELQVLRPESDKNFDTAFDKAFSWIQDSGKDVNPSAVFLYNYKGDPTQMRSDGTMEPYTGVTGEPGKEFILQPSVRRIGDSELKDDLEAVVGPIYFVKATQLVFDNGSLTLGTPGQIVDPHGGAGGALDSNSYPEAVIAYNAQVYLLRSNTFQYVERFDPTDKEVLGQPLFSRNLAVRR